MPPITISMYSTQVNHPDRLYRKRLQIDTAKRRLQQEF
jgi:hypothetical protein